MYRIDENGVSYLPKTTNSVLSTSDTIDDTCATIIHCHTRKHH